VGLDCLCIMVTVATKLFACLNDYVSWPGDNVQRSFGRHLSVYPKIFHSFPHSQQATAFDITQFKTVKVNVLCHC
jgi:hypothetical protein